MKSQLGTLQELGTRLREQATEIADLRAALDIQFKRIADMQAELDQLPQAKRRRQSYRALPIQQPAHNGNRR